jgi:hypothetical protein
VRFDFLPSVGLAVAILFVVALGFLLFAGGR